MIVLLLLLIYAGKDLFLLLFKFLQGFIKQMYFFFHAGLRDGKGGE